MTRTLRISTLIVLCAVAVIGSAAPVAAGGGGCHSPFSDDATKEVKAAGPCFIPAVARVDVGDTVTWFSDSQEHTITGASGHGVADDLPADGQAKATFDEAGVYPYACLLHPGMVGAIVVGDGGTQVSSAPAPSASSTGGFLPTAALAAALVLAAAAALALRRAGGSRHPAPTPDIP